MILCCNPAELEYRGGLKPTLRRALGLIALPSWGNKGAVFYSKGFQDIGDLLFRNSSSANQLPVKSSEIFLVMGIHGQNTA